MRTSPALLLPVIVTVLLGVGGCSAGSDADGAGSPVSRVPRSTPSPATPSAPAAPSAPGGSAPSAGDAATCREVRAGIDAFNAGDFEGTVAYFTKAVPLAQAAATDHPSSAASDLLDAVRYYAALAPQDYSAASVSSAQFAKYKVITLGQCETGEPRGGATTDPGVPI